MSARPAMLAMRGPDGPDTAQAPGTVLRHGPFTIDLDRHEFRCRRKLIELTASEFRIVRHLIERGGYLVTREELMLAALDASSPAHARVIDVHLVSIRRKLGRHCIHTVRGYGYKLTRS